MTVVARVRRMTADDLSRRSLRADAAYCAAAGTAAALARRPFGRLLGLPAPAVATGGAATLAWSGALAALSRAGSLRRPVAGVGAVNTVASLALLAAGARHPRPGARALLVAVGAEVGAFAVSQAVALRAARAAA